MARTLARLTDGSRITDYISLGVIAKAFPKSHVEDVLKRTGRMSVRQRELPAVREDGTIAHAYSWGNTANVKGWHKDAAEDITVANIAIQGKTALDIVADASLIPFIEEAYQIRCKPEFDHLNLVVDANCQTEALALVKLAGELQMKKH